MHNRRTGKSMPRPWLLLVATFLLLVVVPACAKSASGPNPDGAATLRIPDYPVATAPPRITNEAAPAFESPPNAAPDAVSSPAPLLNRVAPPPVSPATPAPSPGAVPAPEVVRAVVPSPSPPPFQATAGPATPLPTRIAVLPVPAVTPAPTSPPTVQPTAAGLQTWIVTPQPATPPAPTPFGAPTVAPAATPAPAPAATASPIGAPAASPVASVAPSPPPPVATPSPSPSPTAAPTPAPTSAPAPSPSAPPATDGVALQIISVTSPVDQGAQATVQAKTSPGAQCAIKVVYKSGPSGAKGLEAKVADAGGNVSWTWQVGNNTTKGSWPITITVTLGGKTASQTVHFTVQ